jgi:hypothetical protein
VNAGFNARSNISIPAWDRGGIDNLWNNIEHFMYQPGGPPDYVPVDGDFVTNWGTAYKGHGWKMFIKKLWCKYEIRNNSAVECKLHVLPHYYSKKSDTHADAITLLNRAGEGLFSSSTAASDVLSYPWHPLGPTVRKAKKLRDLQWGKVSTRVLQPGEGIVVWQQINNRTVDLDDYVFHTNVGYNDHTHYPGVSCGTIFFVNGCIGQTTADDLAGTGKSGYMDCFINIVVTRGATYMVRAAGMSSKSEAYPTATVAAALEVRQQEAPETMEADENA